MSVREWTTLAFRLAGVCFLVLALANTPMSVLLALEDFRANGHLATLGWSALLVVLTMALLGILLMGGSRRLAYYAAPREEGATRGAVAAGTLQAVGFSLVGCVFFCFGILGLAERVVNPGTLLENLHGLLTVGRSRLAEPVFKMVMGLALMIGAKALSRWWSRLRDGSGGAAELPRV
jgi:uncharacterized membrane protein